MTKAKISAADARILAVAYSAYNEANREKFGASRDNSLKVWGRALLDACDRTGVWLYAPSSIRQTIASAEARDTERKSA